MSNIPKISIIKKILSDLDRKSLGDIIVIEKEITPLLTSLIASISLNIILEEKWSEPTAFK